MSDESSGTADTIESLTRHEKDLNFDSINGAHSTITLGVNVIQDSSISLLERVIMTQDNNIGDQPVPEEKCSNPCNVSQDAKMCAVSKPSTRLPLFGQANRRRWPKYSPLSADYCKKKYHFVPIQTQDVPGTFKCTYCPTVCKSQSELVIHKRTHFVCKTCDKCFSSSKYLIEHLKDKHRNSREKRFLCEICGKLYLHSYYLRVHQRVHFADKNWKCNLCDQTFSGQRRLAHHMKKHTVVNLKCGESEEKVYPRNICGKAMNHIDFLNEHMKTHVVEKSTKCKICGITMKHHYSLKKHMKTHTDEFSKKCRICSKWVYVSLKEHMRRTHIGEKPYACIKCGKEYYQEASFKFHMDLHARMGE